jgi:hypothetical protein
LSSRCILTPTSRTKDSIRIIKNQNCEISVRIVLKNHYSWRWKNYAQMVTTYINKARKRKTREKENSCSWKATRWDSSLQLAKSETNNNESKVSTTSKQKENMS